MEPIQPDPAPERDDLDLIDRLKLSRYRKTIAAVVIGLIGWASAVVVSNADAITSGEWVALGTVGAVTVGVYGVRNAK